METQDFTLPYWLDEATGIHHAKDCTPCGGSGESHHEIAGKSVSGTCDMCHGSGVVPTNECPAWIAGLVLADNQRRVFDADKDWDYS